MSLPGRKRNTVAALSFDFFRFYFFTAVAFLRGLNKHQQNPEYSDTLAQVLNLICYGYFSRDNLGRWPSPNQTADELW